MDEKERESISGILEVIKAQSTTLETFREDHSGQAASIEERARDTFQNQYMVISA
jgi:kinesin family protein 11